MIFLIFFLMAGQLDHVSLVNIQDKHHVDIEGLNAAQWFYEKV